MLKKILSVVLTLLVINGIYFVRIDASEREIEGFENLFAFGSASGVAVWNHYLFAISGSNIVVIDFNTESISAVWSLTRAGLPNCQARSIIVTDDFIVISTSTNSVAVLPNEKSFVNMMPPTVIRKIETFANIPLILVKDNYLYAFDLTADEINGISGETAVVWRMDLANIENFPTLELKTTNLNDDATLNSGYVKFLELGQYNSIWNFVTYDENFAYCVVSNNYIIPEATLFLKQINLNDFSTVSELLLDDIYMASGTVKSDSGYLYAVSNADNNSNSLYIVSAMGDELSLVSKTRLALVGSKNGYQDMVKVGGVLLGLIPGNGEKAGVVDVSRPDDVIGNIAETIFLGDMPIAAGIMAPYANIAKRGNRLYYPFSQGISVIKTRENEFSANIADTDVSRYPYVAFGICTKSDMVDVTVGTDLFAVPVAKSTWSLPVYSLPNGNYPVAVSASGGSKDGSISVDVPAAMDIRDVSFGDQKVTANVINNTNYYDKMMQTLSPHFVAAVYDANDKMVSYQAEDIPAAYGALTPISINVAAAPEGGTIKLFTLRNSFDLAPVAPAFIISSSGEVSASDSADAILGTNKGEITVDTRIDAVNKKVFITGNVPRGYVNRAAMMITCTLNDTKTVKEYNQTVTDRDGNFEFVYSYAGDTVASEAVYDVVISSPRYMGDEMGNTQFSCFGVTWVNENLENIKSNIKNRIELKDLLENDKELASAIGVNINNDSYKRLNAERQELVMESVLQVIKSGNKEHITSTFTSESAKQEDAMDIYNVNNAAVSSLMEILSVLKDRGLISQSTFATYSSLNVNTQAKVNSIFIGKGSISNLSEVEPRLLNVITEANQNVSGSGSGGSARGSSSGGGIATFGNQIIVPPIDTPTTPTTPTTLPQPQQHFKDLSDVEWARESILYLEKKGVINGISENVFAPNDYVTREQFVKMLILSFGLKAEGAVCSFTDVSRDEWHYEFVASAEAIGLAIGDGHSFGIGRGLTREEMAVFAYRTAQLADITLPTNRDIIHFDDDASIGEFAKEAVSKMQRAGIMSGMGDGTFSPSSECTRAMAAKVIYELLRIAE